MWSRPRIHVSSGQPRLFTNTGKSPIRTPLRIIQMEAQAIRTLPRTIRTLRHTMSRSIFNLELRVGISAPLPHGYGASSKTQAKCWGGLPIRLPLFALDEINEIRHAALWRAMLHA